MQQKQKGSQWRGSLMKQKKKYDYLENLGATAN